MSTTTFFSTSPDDVYQKDLIQPKDNDLQITVQAIGEDDNPYNFAIHTVKLEIFEHSSDTVAQVTKADGDFTRSQSAGQTGTPVDDTLTTTIDWTDVDTELDELFEYWWRILATDANGKDFTIVYGHYVKDNK